MGEDTGSDNIISVPASNVVIHKIVLFSVLLKNDFNILKRETFGNN